jgi:hypothetical protein
MIRIDRAAILLTGVCLLWFSPLNAQIDTNIVEEEDFSIYDDLEYVDESAKRFANVKVNGKSPDKLISVGYDFQGSYVMDAAAYGIYNASSQTVSATHGLRLSANIPIISKNSIIIQGGLQYWNTQYNFENASQLTHPLHKALSDNGLNNMELSTSVYKPLNETSFLLGRVAAAMSGDYTLSKFQPLNYNRYSIALLWGKKPNESKQWAIGLSQTYQAGELNYLPIIMYNWTSSNRKWGIESLLPARGDVRYNFSQRSMLFLGFDLEGTSYRFGNQNELAAPLNDLEIRRSELRPRLKYERQIVGFVWMSAAVGYRINYSYNVDRVENGKDFYRGFFGDQPFIMENNLTNPLYVNFSINLVSP